MNAMRGNLNIFGSNPLGKRSCLNSLVSGIVFSTRVVAGLFSTPGAPLLVSTFGVQQTAEYGFAKLANGVVWDTSNSWISTHCIMFVVVNIVIIALGFSCGVFSYPVITENIDTTFTKARFQQIAAIEDYDVNKFLHEEGQLNPSPMLGTESSHAVSGETHQNCQPTLSLDSRQRSSIASP